LGQALRKRLNIEAGVGKMRVINRGKGGNLPAQDRAATWRAYLAVQLEKGDGR